ncbi:MAG: hypothetical protein ACRC79_12970, partial [Acinetobacter junii]
RRQIQFAESVFSTSAKLKIQTAFSLHLICTSAAKKLPRCILAKKDAVKVIQFSQSFSGTINRKK